MTDFISREAAIEALKYEFRDYMRGQDALDKVLAADVAPVVRCKDCRHRIVNENYGKKGYMRLKAMCDLDTGDPFELGRNAEDDDWFCADGERRK